jgi:hypothetical protein
MAALIERYHVVLLSQTYRVQRSGNPRGGGLGDALQSAPEARVLGREYVAIYALVARGPESIGIDRLGLYLDKQIQQHAEHVLVPGLFQLFLEPR